jgi:hypothetical protein
LQALDSKPVVLLLESVDEQEFLTLVKQRGAVGDKPPAKRSR